MFPHRAALLAMFPAILPFLLMAPLAVIAFRPFPFFISAVAWVRRRLYSAVPQHPMHLPGLGKVLLVLSAALLGDLSLPLRRVPLLALVCLRSL